MDPDGPEKVLKGVLASSVAGGILGGVTYTVIGKTRSPLLSAAGSALNSGIVGLTFFSLREYIVSPALVQTVPWPSYTRKREMFQANDKSSLPSRPISFSEMRTNRVLDSALAGSLTGGILNTWRHGPSGILPGAITATLLCSALQLAWNEANVLRVKYVSRVQGIEPPPKAFSPAPQRSMSQTILEGLGMVFPVKKIPDDVYLEKLQRKLEEVEKSLEVVRQEMRDAEAMSEEENDNRS